MEIRVLGCDGGIGDGRRTTAFLVDHDLLIDCGSGVGVLALEEMCAIRHVFLTHAHLDHHAFLPFLLDSIFERIQEPVEVHGLESTLETLQEHIFNWHVWPDFTRLPSPDRPRLRFRPLRMGEVRELPGGRTVEALPVAHSVPAVGYRVSDGHAVWAFSGDSGPNDAFWEALNAHPRLDLLVVETAFPRHQHRLAELSKHYHPGSLAQDLRKLRHRPEVWLTHLKPGAEDTIYRECREALPEWPLRRLRGGEVFRL